MWPTVRRPKRTSGTIAMARLGWYLKIERESGQLSKLQRAGSVGWLGNLSDSGNGEAIMIAYLVAEGFKRGIGKDVACMHSGVASEGNGMQLSKLQERMRVEMKAYCKRE